MIRGRSVWRMPPYVFPQEYDPIVHINDPQSRHVGLGMVRLPWQSYPVGWWGKTTTPLHYSKKDSLTCLQPHKSNHKQWRRLRTAVTPLCACMLLGRDHEGLRLGSLEGREAYQIDLALWALALIKLNFRQASASSSVGSCWALCSSTFR